MQDTSIYAEISEDKKRMKRKVNLSVYDLDCLVDLVATSKSNSFRRGDKDRTEYLQRLQDLLKKYILKESHE